MHITHTIPDLRAARRALIGPADTLALVPTMGALHDGHRSLLRRAREECSVTVATIFVNPLQFAPSEDLSRYPRTFEADCAMLEAEGIDILFAPSPEAMYPGARSSGAPATATLIHVEGIEDRLDGASRPGHFTGVATVVAKLFHIVQPTHACFGQKDAAQLAVLRRMVRDLDFDLTLIACPIVRDQDGLALSSRNRYLSAEERTRALILPHTLNQVETRIRQGIRDSATLLSGGRALLSTEPSVALDYLAIVDPDTLLPVPEATPGTLLAIAAKVGTTRLIDNLLLP